MILNGLVLIVQVSLMLSALGVGFRLPPPRAAVRFCPCSCSVRSPDPAASCDPQVSHGMVRISSAPLRSSRLTLPPSRWRQPQSGGRAGWVPPPARRLRGPSVLVPFRAFWWQNQTDVVSVRFGWRCNQRNELDRRKSLWSLRLGKFVSRTPAGPRAQARNELSRRGCPSR